MAEERPTIDRPPPGATDPGSGEDEPAVERVHLSAEDVPFPLEPEEGDRAAETSEAPSQELRPLGGLGQPGEAMRDLAIAFRTSAETIEGVKELQGELVRTLKRQDRSELVLQSTQALNDTFRNLTTVQRELLGRLEQGGRSSGARVVPLMLIALLVVFLGGIYLVITVLDELRTERVDPQLVADRATNRALQAFTEGQHDRDETHERDLDSLRGRLEQMQTREQALRQRLDEEGLSGADLLKQVRKLEAEREGLAQQILAARNEVMAKRALESELRANAGRLAVMEPRVQALERSVEDERSENARLRRRLAALGYGLPDPEGEGPEPGRPNDSDDADVSMPESRPPAEEVKATPRRIDRDPVLLEKIRDRVNQMLDASAQSRTHVWQVTRIDGVSPDRLMGVIAMRYERQSGKLVGQALAKELELWVDRNRRSVDLLFKDGTLRTEKGTQPIPAGGLAQTVANGEIARIWGQSGLLFLRFK